MTADMDPRLREDLAGREYAWMRDAKVCKVGQYEVIGPASDGDETILVLKGKEGIFARGPGNAQMFKDGRAVATLQAGQSPTTPFTLSYDVHDDSTGLVTTVLDRDLDGQADMRTRYLKGRDMAIEIWADNRWQTLVRRNGQPGLMQNRQFVPYLPAESILPIETK